MQPTQGHDSLRDTCGYVSILSTLGMQATHGLWRGLVMLIQRPFVPPTNHGIYGSACTSESSLSRSVHFRVGEGGAGADPSDVPHTTFATFHADCLCDLRA